MHRRRSSRVASNRRKKEVRDEDTDDRDDDEEEDDEEESNVVPVLPPPSPKGSPQRRKSKGETNPSPTSSVVSDGMPEIPAAAKEPVTMKKVMTRTITALVCCAAYLVMLRAGHFYCILVAFLTQVELFREMCNVRYVAAKAVKMPWFRTLQWSWFALSMFFMYGDTLNEFLIGQKLGSSWLQNLSQKMVDSVFWLYTILFIVSVLTLRPGLVKFQISQMVWTVIIICMVVFQCRYFALNALNGLFWFFFPMATVVMNDCSAYFCGISMGRKFIKAPFIALSPNKTWEGFLGAAVLTMIFSFFFPALLARFKYFVCPMALTNATGTSYSYDSPDSHYLSIAPFPPLYPECEPSHFFTWQEVEIPDINIKVEMYPIQMHGLAYGLFASLVAPFGGFFASAIKRAYKKKDFDSFMPGHGGLMDRMDCQLLMLAFTSFHYRTFIAPAPNVSKMLYLASLMSPALQKELVLELAKKIGMTCRE